MYSPTTHTKRKTTTRRLQRLTLPAIRLSMPLTLSILLLSMSLTLQAQEADETPWDQRTKQSLNTIALEADDAYFNTGITVWDLTADSLLWDYNGHKVMRPASTQKVVTAIAALSSLGARHEIRTNAYYTGLISPDSTLHGDIYVVGDFDPMFSYSDLRKLAYDA